MFTPLNTRFFNTDLCVHMLKSIGVDNPHLTVNQPGLASLRNGRAQYWSAMSPHQGMRSEYRNTLGRSPNYGLFGGTVDFYENIIIDLFETGFVNTVLSNLNNNKDPVLLCCLIILVNELIWDNVIA